MKAVRCRGEALDGCYETYTGEQPTKGAGGIVLARV